MPLKRFNYHHHPFIPTGTSYYLIAGTPAEILSAVSAVSGPAPMFPKSALGFANSQWVIDETELKSILSRQAHPDR